MQLIIKQNQPLNHAQGLILSVLIYILPTFENGPRRVQRNAKNWNQRDDTQIEARFQHPKRSRFFFSYGWARGQSQIKGGPLFAPITKLHVEMQLKRKRKRKRKKMLKARPSLSFLQKFPASSPSSPTFSSCSSITIVSLLQASNSSSIPHKISS